MPSDASPEPMPTPMVAARAVSKIFKGAPAVAGASFDVMTGRFMTILGPSGSGKTTLLRMIAGFIAPTSGEILIKGSPVSALPPHRRSIGMVFQKLALFPHMTAAENIAYPLRMRRFDATTIPARVARYLDLVRLPGLGDRHIHELSGGQQQRVAIARALVFEPDLLLLDEPLAALDRKLREEMQLEFRRIQRDLGVTTINVTHDQREALVMSDDVLVMDGGVIQQNASPVVTYTQPANPFVARFIGVTNILSGAALDSGGTRFRSGSVELAGHVLDGSTILAGAPVDAVVRAERVRIAGDAVGLRDLANHFEGTVADMVFEGERILLELDAPALGQPIRAILHDPDSSVPISPGAAIHFGFNAADCLVFPQQPALRPHEGASA
jgi:putative spermidine/putrescine transport system ATP-binding protein